MFSKVDQSVRYSAKAVLESLETRRLLSFVLDPSFGTNGYTTVDTGNDENALDMAIQPDGKILTAGHTLVGTDSFAYTVTRFNSDGTLDDGGVNDSTPGDSFGTGGVAVVKVSQAGWFPEPILLLDPSGKIVVVVPGLGNDVLIKRLLSDGSNDPSFVNGGSGALLLNLSIGGSYTGDVTDAALQFDGNGQVQAILISGVARYNDDYYSYVARITPSNPGGLVENWGLDLSWGNGLVPGYSIFFNSPSVTRMGLQSDGKIVAASWGGVGDIVLTRLMPDGYVDYSFGNNGVVVPQNTFIEEFFEDVVIGTDDSIFIAGGFYNTSNIPGGDDKYKAFVHRLLPDGSPDSSYGVGGLVVYGESTWDLLIYGLTVDASNRVLMTGYSGVAFLGPGATTTIRLTTSGVPDNTFAPNGMLVTNVGDSAAGLTIGVQGDGKIVVAGAITGLSTTTDAIVYRYYEPPPPSTPVYIDGSGNLVVPGTTGDDVFTVQTATGGVRVIYNGVDAGVFTPTGQILITAGAGNDLVSIDNAVTFDAVITGGAGNDTLIGGGGNDSISGGGGDDVLTGQDGNDTLRGNTGADLLDGGNGDDDLLGGADNDTSIGGAGNDSIANDGGDDSLLGGDGDDTLRCGGGADYADGQAGNDSIIGGTGNDSLFGGADNDTILGGSGNDFIDGGDGDDSLNGQGGADIVLGGTGADLVTGGADRDILIGGAGGDRIAGNADEDILVAGTVASSIDEAALTAIMAEWTSSRTYAQRVANIRNGSGTAERLNGSNFLTPDVTVFDDGVSDTLTGGAGVDWFLFNADGSAVDIITDLRAAEFADDLDFINS